MTARPISIKGTGGKSGGRVSKAVELISGDLRHVGDSRLWAKRFTLILPQKSAAGVVLTEVRKAQTVSVGSRTSDSWQPCARQSAPAELCRFRRREAETETCRVAKLLWRTTTRIPGPHRLNLRNRRMRTRMYVFCTLVWQGRVGDHSPYADSPLTSPSPIVFAMGHSA